MSEWNRKDPLNRPMPDASSGRASALRRAAGLGSSRSGTEHWRLQRVTAVALVPLSVWFIAALIANAGAEHASTWLARPWVALPMMVLVIVTFQHTRLGLQVVVEDYVHSDRLKFALVASVHAASYLLMAIGVFATLLIALK